ncbi:uncharacterized protein LOC131258288 isoform X2 [Magnolia sinica]|uniref:uncharacterized protein LOC131258288 isoform X2 n=1 Tax=Magnolia sinica TaxID=86752 RepID=UPI002659DCDB|nr:uncharacterized protein LOC131258288 isoform X2 [Magnolia sinica]
MAGNFRDLRLRCRFLFHPPSLSPFLSMGFCDFQPQKRCLETLAYEEIRASEKEEENVPSQSTALVLHGLLGSARNWRSFSRSLLSKIADSSSSTEWKMVLVDLRNHGRSAEIEGLDPPHDMVNAARDLANLVKFRGWSWPDVVIGHSMGGKVALQFAESCARGDYGESAALPKQLWVLDSVVGEVNPDDSDGEVEKVLKTLQSLPSSLPSRKWLVDHMMELGFSKSLSEWIGSNLKKSDGHLTWAFNLQGAVEMFDSYSDLFRIHTFLATNRSRRECMHPKQHFVESFHQTLGEQCQYQNNRVTKLIRSKLRFDPSRFELRQART